MAEISRAAAWIVARLRADSTLTGLAPGAIWNGPAPEGTAYPFVRFDLMSGTDTYPNGRDVPAAYVDCVYNVYATINSDDEGAVEPVADRINLLLHGQSGSIRAGMIWSCTREMPFKQREDTEGETFLSLGGQYRIMASQA